MAKSTFSVEPYNVIFCDDIRREFNGKELLIGVYSADLVLPAVPAVVAMALFIQLKIKGEPGTIRRRLRVNDPSGNRAGETVLEQTLSEVQITKDEERTFAISMPQLAVSVVQPGEIKVYWEGDDGRFTLIGEKRVVIGHVPTALTPS